MGGCIGGLIAVPPSGGLGGMGAERLVAGRFCIFYKTDLILGLF